MEILNVGAFYYSQNSMAKVLFKAGVPDTFLSTTKNVDNFIDVFREGLVADLKNRPIIKNRREGRFFGLLDPLNINFNTV